MERRAFARVTARIQGRLRKLANAEEAPLFTTTTQSSNVSLTALRSSSIPEPVIKFFESIDQKLDTLINLRQKDTLQHDFPHRFDTLEISGSGMIIATDAPITAGSYIETVMFLGHYPMNIAGTIAQVTKKAPMEAPHEVSEQSNIWIIEFSRIREQDLDSVVQFVFSEERRQIREKKFS